MNCLAQRKKFKGKQPVWLDPDDPKHAEPVEEQAEDAAQLDSAQTSESSDEDDDNELYANDVRSKKYNLECKELRYKHLTNINNERSYKGAVQQVQFHPKSKIALVTVSYGQADLFEVDGERNRYLQRIKLPRTQAPFCSFKPDGDSIVITSEQYRGQFHTYDLNSSSINSYSLRIGRDPKDISDFIIYDNHMACRKEGSPEILFLNSKTYENTFSLKINEPAKSIRFTKDNQVFIAGENGHVYIWDLRKTSLCKHKFQDEGSVHTTSMCLSESSMLLSIGSDSGIVNTYELDDCKTKKFPTPIRTFTNLKTKIDLLNYNHSGELLLIGSKAAPGAFRLVHSHSGTVYRNFPSAKKKYGHLLSTDFSPLSGYLALGCSTGRAFLCRIPYFKTY